MRRKKHEKIEYVADSETVIMGLDTSSRRVGWGVVSGRINPQQNLTLGTPTLASQYRDLKYIDSGVIILSDKEHHLARQCRLQDEIRALIMWHDVKKIAIEDLKSLKNAKVARILQGYITSASLAAWRALNEAPILIVQERVRKRIGVPSISPAEKRGRTSEEISLEMKTKVCVTISREFNLEGKTFDETDALSVAVAGLWGP